VKVEEEAPGGTVGAVDRDATSSLRGYTGQQIL
jgi:hypothetical protein